MAVLRGGSTVGGSTIVTKQDVPINFRESGGRLQFLDGATWKNAGTDTSDATAVAGHILSGQTAYVNDVKITGTIASRAATTITPSGSAQTIPAGVYLSGVQTISAVTVPVANVLAGTTIAGQAGTMVNRGNVTNTVTTQGGSYTIPQGYHTGSGKVTASFANLVAGNVKSGVNIGGVVGTLPKVSGVSQVTHTHSIRQGVNSNQVVTFPAGVTPFAWTTWIMLNQYPSGEYYYSYSNFTSGLSLSPWCNVTGRNSRYVTVSGTVSGTTTKTVTYSINGGASVDLSDGNCTAKTTWFYA